MRNNTICSKKIKINKLKTKDVEKIIKILLVDKLTKFLYNGYSQILLQCVTIIYETEE